MIIVQNVRQDKGMGLYGENEAPSSCDFYFSMITYGKCVFWLNGNKLILQKGELLLIPGTIPFYWKGIPTVFHEKYVAELRCCKDSQQLPVLASQQPVHAKIGCFDLVNERMKALGTGWAEKLPYYEIYAAALIMEILTLWNREMDRGDLTSEKQKNVEILKHFMHEHYRDKLTKDDLAGVIRKSPNYTATLFREVTGQTISEYVHALRIKKAVFMLGESRLNVAEIAEFLGYTDVSYFHRTFKRITGGTPSDFFGERMSAQR